MTPWGKKWEKQEKSGKMRQTNVAIVWVLDWVGLKTTQVRPAFRLQDYTTAQKNEEKKKPPQHHSAYSLSLPHERGKETWKQKYLQHFQTSNLWHQETRKSNFVFQTFDEIGNVKKAQESFSSSTSCLTVGVTQPEWFPTSSSQSDRQSREVWNSPVSLRLK